jgi:hypothetical protein
MEVPGTMSPHPMVEMSQDCIEWDESRNVDLRHLDKSPCDESSSVPTPKSSGPNVQNVISTPRSSSSNNKMKGCPSSLDGIKRRLASSGISPSPDAESSGRPSRSVASAPSRRKIQPTEREIDGIFSTLEQEEARMGPFQLSPASVDLQEHRVLPIASTTEPTQPTRNRSFTMETATETEGAFLQTATTATATFLSTSSVATWHRRRRPRELENIHPNLVPFSNKHRRFNRATTRKTSPQEALGSHHKVGESTTGPVLPSTNNMDDDDEGDFEELLKQMDTPQSATSTSHTTITEESNMIPSPVLPPYPQPFVETSLEGLRRNLVNNDIAISPRNLAKATHIDSQAIGTTQASKEIGTRHHGQSHAGNASNMYNCHTSQHRGESNTAMQRQNAVGRQSQSLPPPRHQPKPLGNAYALQRLDQTNVLPHQKNEHGSGAYKASCALPMRSPSPDTFTMPPPPAKNLSVTPMAMPPIPPRSSVASTKPEIRHNATVPAASQKLDDDGAEDEFGDFGLLDFGDLDALLAIQCSQQLTQVESSMDQKKATSKDSKTYHETHKLRNVAQDRSSCMTVISSIANKNTTSVTRLSLVVEDKENAPTAAEDEFGDFPDIDFDAIDQVIAKRESLSPCCDGQAPLSSPLTTAPPSPSMIVKNPKTESFDSEGFAFLTFSRYKVLSVEDDSSTYTKALLVAGWTTEMMEHEKQARGMHKTLRRPTRKRNLEYQPAGRIYLRCEWYHTRIAEGDVLHLCSPSGKYRTDEGALPIVVDSAPPAGSDADDLVVVMHPDLLITPTTVSETVGCSRRAVLKSRIGSTGLSSQAALFGTMRHELFGVCMKQQDFSLDSVRTNVRKIVRRNATNLIGCGLTVPEAESGVIDILPSIHRFVAEYTRIGVENGDEIPFHRRPLLEGHGHQPSIRLVADVVESIEEPVISPELGLKGNVDAVVNVTSVRLNSTPSSSAGPQNSFMCLELKTGHNQNTQNGHMAQLALYTLMLQVRHGIKSTSSSSFQSSPLPCSQFGGGFPDATGAATGGILVYLNQKSTRSVHVSPQPNEIKSLIGQRNVVASEVLRASRPRGVELVYDEKEMDMEDRSPR